MVNKAITQHTARLVEILNQTPIDFRIDVKRSYVQQNASEFESELRALIQYELPYELDEKTKLESDEVIADAISNFKKLAH